MITTAGGGAIRDRAARKRLDACACVVEQAGTNGVLTGYDHPPERQQLPRVLKFRWSLRSLGRMPWLMRRRARTILPSEKGLLDLAGRQADLPLREIFVYFRDLVSEDMTWADSRKARFRRSASRVKLASLLLAALSTVVLGIKAIPAQAEIALPLVATVTLLGGLETFFNWRSRWVLMEETQYRLNRLRDDMDYYLMVTPSDGVQRAALDRFYTQQQDIWSDVSRRWVEFRALDAAQPTGRSTFSGTDGG